MYTADNALQTGQIAVKSAESARNSGKAVAEAVTAMKAIAKQIEMVEEIASQTHMLSLNATLEATRDRRADEVIKMNTNGNGGDELDVEFERVVYLC